MNTIRLVAEFHHAFGQPSAATPELPPTPGVGSIAIAIASLDEALGVLKHGARMGCRRSLRLALNRARAGHVWTRFDESFRRVHEANMAKLGPDGKPAFGPTGKIVKPDGWAAPDLSDLVQP